MLMQPNDAVRGLYASRLAPFVERAFYELRPGHPYHPSYHVRAICHQLERVANGECCRLLLLMPPRHGKSHCASVAFPTWVLGRDPKKRIIDISYGTDLAETFAFESRRLMQSDWHRATFTSFAIDSKKASLDNIRTTSGGFRLATSKGGALTGKGADILIIDDPSKAADVASETLRDGLWEWFTGTAITRLDKPKEGAVIVVAQRLHVDDLPGRLIATGEWDVLELPAIETRERRIDLGDDMEWPRAPGDILFPEVVGEEELARIRSEMGSIKFEAQYQQAPVPAAGNIVKTHWFKTIPSQIRRRDYEGVVQSWDVAAVPGESNDYSVCTTWGLIGNYVDLLDVYRAQHDPPQLLKVARKLRVIWKPDLLAVETQGVGHSLKSHLRQDDRRGVRGVSAKLNKVERMLNETFVLEAGHVRLPDKAPWKELFLDEVAAFPNGKYDDQVDSMSQTLFAIRLRPSELRHCSRYKG